MDENYDRPVSRHDLLFTVEMALRKASKLWPWKRVPGDHDRLRAGRGIGRGTSGALRDGVLPQTAGAASQHARSVRCVAARGAGRTDADSA